MSSLVYTYTMNILFWMVNSIALINFIMLVLVHCSSPLRDVWTHILSSPSISSLSMLPCCVKSLQLSPTLCDPINCSPPGSSVHGILQARILEWAATLFSRGSSWPRDRTWVSHIAVRFFTVWATREAHVSHSKGELRYQIHSHSCIHFKPWFRLKYVFIFCHLKYILDI